IVAKNQLDLLTIDAALGVDVGCCLLGAVLELGTEGSIGTRQRTCDPDFDLRRCAAGAGNTRDDGQRRPEHLLHTRPPDFDSGTHATDTRVRLTPDDPTKAWQSHDLLRRTRWLHPAAKAQESGSSARHPSGPRRRNSHPYWTAICRARTSR